jgi:2'-5' RNA ligase
MPRLFTGLEIPPDVATGLALYRGGLMAARWIEPSDYHVTLRFIGDIEPRLAHEIDGHLARLARPPLTLTLDGLDSFGGDRPRSLFARVVPTAPLAEMQAEQERLLRRLGLPSETRRFVPHVTLARFNGVSPLAVADYLSSRPMLRPISFVARRVALFSSRASVGGGPYVVEAAYPLDAPARRAM